MAQPIKADSEMVENTAITAATDEDILPTSKGGAPVMRSKADDLSVWQTVRIYKRVGLIAMAAGFCASLDGYRNNTYLIQSSILF
jgi:SP family general alpha glucoside:H+ symporter-like MFS transporter